jgi:Bromodomain associated
MQESLDDNFCSWTAQRAVARASLHLGIESCSAEALETLADVLIVYIERIGSCMATSIEASGRSSMHANSLDALRAVEVCAESAVQRIHTQGLAAFCAEWKAPCLDAIPPFPVTHNPYASITESMHKHVYGVPSETNEKEHVDNIPDTVFTSEWGVTNGQADTANAAAATQQETATQPEQGSPSKKPRLTYNTDDRPPWLPTHFPALSKKSDALTIVDEAVAESTTTPQATVRTEPSTNIRTALVDLEAWGSGWDRVLDLAVPSGRTETTSNTHPQIVPIGRASISRVARILEGSLDANAA